MYSMKSACQYLAIHPTTCRGWGNSCYVMLKLYICNFSGFSHKWRRKMNTLECIPGKEFLQCEENSAMYHYSEIIDEVGIKVQNANTALGIEYDRVNKCLKTPADWNDPLQRNPTDKFEMIVHPLWKHDGDVDQNIFQLLRGIYSSKRGRQQVYAYMRANVVNQQTTTTTGRNLLGD